MGTIMTRPKKDGSKRYTATIRKKKGGKVVLSLSETFLTENAAERWMENRELALTKKGAVGRAIAKRKRKTWADEIDDYIAASPEGFGKTKTANLAYLQRLDFGKMAVDSTDNYDFFNLAQDLLRGVQAPPAGSELDSPEHHTLQPRMPQTVNSYMATLRGQRAVSPGADRPSRHGGPALTRLRSCDASCPLPATLLCAKVRIRPTP